jgi:hypothetical protein
MSPDLSREKMGVFDGRESAKHHERLCVTPRGMTKDSPYFASRAKILSFDMERGCVGFVQRTSEIRFVVEPVSAESIWNDIRIMEFPLEFPNLDSVLAFADSIRSGAQERHDFEYSLGIHVWLFCEIMYVMHRGMIFYS